MKKIGEKIILIVQICITLIFILTAALYMMNVIPQQENWQENGVMTIVMIVLGIVYVGLSVYMIYCNFSAGENLKSILLYCDSESATRTNLKVLKTIVKGCDKQVDGISVKKIRVKADEKGGMIAIVYVRTDAKQVAESVNKLRCLLADSFKNTLGLTFNTINFEVIKLNGSYQPDVHQAEELTENLTTNQAETDENYREPLVSTETNHESHDEEPAHNEQEPTTDTEPVEEPRAEEPTVENNTVDEPAEPVEHSDDGAQADVPTTEPKEPVAESQDDDTTQD